MRHEHVMCNSRITDLTLIVSLFMTIYHVTLMSFLFFRLPILIFINFHRTQRFVILRSLHASAEQLRPARSNYKARLIETSCEQFIPVEMITSAQFVILQVINKCIGMAPINIELENKSFLQNCLNAIPIMMTSLLSVGVATYLLYHPIFESSGTIHGIINFASLLSVWLIIISGNGQCFLFSTAYQNINDQIRRIEKRYKDNFSPEFTINLSRQYRRKVCMAFSLFFVSQGILFYEVRLLTGTNGMWSSLLTSLL